VLWIIQLLVILFLTAIVSAWARAARTDRTLRAALFGLLWVSGVGSTVAGLGLIAGGQRLAPGVPDGLGSILATTGAALTIPLIGPVRRLLARILPFDPESIPDLVGLSILLAMIGANLATLLWLSESLRIVSVTVPQLIGQSVTLLGMALLVVGLGMERDLRATAQRLGLILPTATVVLLSLGFTALLFVVAGLAGAATQWLQPELAREIEDRLIQITQDVSSAGGALAVGIAVGVGEEMLFRGAIQPRFGIVLTSVLFTLVHVQYGLSLITAGVFAMSLLLGLERRYLGTTACILTHATYDVAALLLQTLAPAT
jgi:membrane protease YdiL (CAAX protease family)